MAEAMIRERFHGQRRPLLLDEAELTTRCVSRLAAPDGRALVLADLTQPLTTLGMDGRMLTVTDYLGPNLWSSALHAAFPEIDGLYFRSRLANAPSVAVFGDRTRLALAGLPIPLMDLPELPAFLDANGIGIAPGCSWMD